MQPGRGSRRGGKSRESPPPNAWEVERGGNSRESPPPDAGEVERGVSPGNWNPPLMPIDVWEVEGRVKSRELESHPPDAGELDKGGISRESPPWCRGIG